MLFREEISVDPETGARKGVKPARFDLIPVIPLYMLALVYGYGTRKYAERNWEGGYDWSKTFAALQRHAWQFWGGEDIDHESGLPHMAHVAWHAFTLLEYAWRHPDRDDRAVPELVCQRLAALAGRQEENDGLGAIGIGGSRELHGGAEVEMGLDRYGDQLLGLDLLRSADSESPTIRPGAISDAELLGGDKGGVEVVASGGRMRRFALIRLRDSSGVSGTGVVAEGIQFSDGRCALRWLTETASTGIYDGIEELLAIHGHGGLTVVAWVDEPEDE